MTERPYKEGDVFLVFRELPYDFTSGKLPIEVLENLHFDYTPSELLDPRRSCDRDDMECMLENAAVIGLVLPGHGLPGIGFVNCCLRLDSRGINGYPGFGPSRLFATSITSLRLQRPCSIQVGGQFTVGSNNEPIENPGLWNLTSKHNPKPALRYSKDDIHVSSEICKDLLEVLRADSTNRMTSAVVYFSQVTQGFSISLQLAYLGLWSALEALFQPKKQKAKTLARRITSYLSGFQSFEDMERWLVTEYVHRRSTFTHGSHVAPDNLQKNMRGKDAFRRLHEVTRLCLLGFLSLEKSDQNQFFFETGRKLQKNLDALGQAKGKYLGQQEMYL